MPGGMEMPTTQTVVKPIILLLISPPSGMILLVIWDRLPAHRGQAVKDFLKQGATQRLHLEHLPAYAPDLNPDEGIWCYLKQVELANVCCHSLPELRVALRRAIARLRRKTDIILACFREVGLSSHV